MFSGYPCRGKTEHGMPEAHSLYCAQIEQSCVERPLSHAPRGGAGPKPCRGPALRPALPRQSWLDNASQIDYMQINVLRLAAESKTTRKLPALARFCMKMGV